VNLLLSDPAFLSVAAGGLTDPYFSNVSLLLHGDGTNGSTTITDSSSNNFSVTANDGAQISTAQAKYGPSSIEFSGSVNDGLSIQSATDFQFGTGDWTVEAWIYQRSQAQYTCLLEIGNHSQTDSMLVIVGTYNNSRPSVYSGAFFNGPSSVTQLATNQWQFVTVSRSGSSLYFSVGNGVVSSVATFARNLTDYSTVSLGHPYGYNPSASFNVYRFDGFIDELRITKGVARYTSNFTPPTAPFPNA
jgi:hypothetical protein